jgi:WD40 repeat protein
MKFTVPGRWIVLGVVALAVGSNKSPGVAPPHYKAKWTKLAPAEQAVLASRAQAVLKSHCYRCHGQDGAVEGGMNFILDREKLVSRRLVILGQADKSPLYRKVAGNKMPPPSEKTRPSAADLAVLKRWIDHGAPSTRPATEVPLITDAAVYEIILRDLDKVDRRARRFTRYFSLAPLANAGHGPDELKTYRNALGKLINSLSWHPKITLPQSADAAGLVLRIDLRDFQWDANLWNKVLAEYPYGILHDSAVARAVLIATATRVPVVRADWFVATASRAPLYYEILQIPSSLSELERQLRVDVAANIQQERVARAAFNGSGISRNNRVLERHDAMNGAYWRTYDFEAVPQNLLERNILAPDRRNLFAFPLGPGSAENQFQHAGGEAIFNLPNGLQGYVLVNANNVRVNKAPTAIVSDAKRPDRAVEAGLSCMNCHYRGILPKDDQIRGHVAKNKKAFSRADTEVINALYPPAKKMRTLMEDDAERFRKAVEKTGNKITTAEVVMAMTLRYEADVDLPTLAAEVGLRSQDLLPRLTETENQARNLGALKVAGGTVSRQVVAQAFADLVKDLRLGGVFMPGVSGENLPDATGEADPLEALSSPANAVAFSPDRTLAAFASADRSVRIHEVEGQRDLRRGVGHTASVWSVAFSSDGARILSGGKDGTVRLWDVETAREIKKIDAHDELVSALAFSPDGKRALSAGYDHEAALWDLDKGERVAGFSFKGVARYLNAVAFSPNGKWAVVAGEKTLYYLDATTGKVTRKMEGHRGWITCLAFSADGKQVISGSDDSEARLWDVANGKTLKVFRGHEGYVKAVSLRQDSRLVLTGGSDGTVRLFDAGTASQWKVFRKHSEPLAAAAFLTNGRQTVSCSRDGKVLLWSIGKRQPNSPPRDPNPLPPAITPDPAAKAIRPVAVLPVGGTVGGMMLSPDGKTLYYFNRTDGVMGKVDLAAYRRTATLRLAEGTNTVGLSPDGKWFAAVASGKGDKSKSSVVQVIDPDKFRLRKSFEVVTPAYDMAVSDRGMLYLSADGDDWTNITVIDLEKARVAASWAGVWARSFLQMTKDGKRLYYSSQGVTPGTLDGLVIPTKLAEKPEVSRAPGHDKLALGGEFVLSADSKYLLAKTGTILRLSADRDADMKFHKKVPAFLGAATDPAGGWAYLLGRDGALRRYTYPAFELRSTHRLSLSGYDLALDPTNGRLFVAGFDPAAVADRPRAKGHGDIQVYRLKDIAVGVVKKP